MRVVLIPLTFVSLVVAGCGEQRQPTEASDSWRFR